MRIGHDGDDFRSRSSLEHTEGRVKDFEAERPSDFELPSIKADKYDNLVVKEWKGDSSGRETMELPSLATDSVVENTYDGLTEEEKIKAKEETGFADEIMDAIGSEKELEIYKKAGLVEAEIGGKKCLIREDIELDKKLETGKYDENDRPIYETNRERMEKGRAPLDENGNPIQLHHIGQHADSPLAELTFEEHRCNGNDTILHDKTKETETHGEGNTWDRERQDYWKVRAVYNEGGNSDDRYY